MTNQEIFNEVWNHFVVNKNPQAWDGNSCKYKTEDGRKCALGIFIPEDEYNPDFESLGSIVHNGMVRDILRGVFEEISISFLSSIQLSHDSHEGDLFHSGIERDLRSVANNYNLQVPV